ncbi:MAG: hypothetical protein J7K72_05030 [Candidatus Aenigmarchaeota archaeon]|nr:hypothetical protein [Candidatus Aenigmarchaeota archaeon]
MGNKYPMGEENESSFIESIYESFKKVGEKADKIAAIGLAVLALDLAACNKPPSDENKKVEVPTVAEKAKEYKTATSQDEYKRLEEAVKKFYGLEKDIKIVKIIKKKADPSDDSVPLGSTFIYAIDEKGNIYQLVIKKNGEIY